MKKIVDYACPKVLPRIEDIVGHIEKFGDVFCEAYLTATPLLPFFRGCD
jgi:hypothetical protein